MAAIWALSSSISPLAFSGLPGEVPVHRISSPVGHDAFLTQIHQLDDQLRGAFYPTAQVPVGFPPADT